MKELPNELDLVYEVGTRDGGNWWVTEEEFKHIAADMRATMNPFDLLEFNSISGSTVICFISQIAALNKSTREEREFSNKMNKLYNEEVKANKNWNED